MIVRTADDLQLAHNVLSTADKAALDTETTGLKEHDRPFVLVAATRDHEFYFDRRILGDSIISQFTLDLPEELIFQNAKFDLRMMAAQGWGPGGPSVKTIRDTEVLARLVRNDHLAYNLASIAKREGFEKSGDVMSYIKDHKLKTKVYRKWKDDYEELLHFDRVPTEVIAPYALTDARITFDIYEKLLPKLDPRSEKVWANECKLTNTCYHMERRGLQINLEYTEQALNYERSLIREAKNQFLLACGKVYDNTKGQLVEVFSNAGETIPKTEKGNDSLTDDVLESFTSPIAKIVQKIRFYEKRCSTYYTSYLEMVDEHGRLHPDMRQAGTTTGRFAYREPNLQNLPKKGEEEERFSVRGCFQPRPGYVFVAMDYSQQEYRLMLAYAKHWQLIEQVMGGMDIHQATADMVGIQRYEAKTLNFAILYGAGVDKIAQMLGCDYDTAYRLKQKYFSRLREVQVLINEVTNRGKGTGHIYNWLGRKLSVNHRDFAYKLPNYLIQGGGADICKVAMNACFDRLLGWDCHMVLQVHDAIYFEMREQDMEHLIPSLKKIMIDSFPAREGMMMDVDVQWSRTSLAERDLIEWQSCTTDQASTTSLAVNPS
jgi:DNA polymerase-1